MKTKSWFVVMILFFSVIAIIIYSPLIINAACLDKSDLLRIGCFADESINADPESIVDLTTAANTMLVAQVPSAPATGLLDTDTNPILLENQQPGTAGWKLGRKANDSAGQIKGYASSTSVNQGDSIDFHISVDKPQTYKIDIYRMGWYQGYGGRLMTSVGPLPGTRQAPPVYDRNTGLIYCPWSKSYTLQIPENWTSGIYLAKLTNANNYQNYIVFVVRDDNRHAALLYQQTVMTYQAYNNYPHDQRTGKSFYEGPSRGDQTLAGGKRAVAVSFDRPYSRDGSGKFFVWEYYFVRWIEQQGYDVAYATNLDIHRNGERLLNYNTFVSSGHDEYWTYEMFDAAEHARDQGVNLAFFSGNTIYWQVRMEPSVTGQPDRVMIGYKDVARLDPIANRTRATDKWRNVGRPEQGLLGVLYPQGGIGSNTAYQVAASNHWAYAGTGMQNGDKIPAIIGYEIDSYDSSLPLPAYKSYTRLASSEFYGRKKKFFADTILYETANNAKVFAGGTTSWSWGLDKPGYSDLRLQKITANLLDNLSQRVQGAHLNTTLVRPETLLSAQQLKQFDCAFAVDNLLSGANFEATGAGWRLSTQGQLYSLAEITNATASSSQHLSAIAAGGCGQALHLTGPTNQPVQLFQDDIQLEANRQYRLSVALTADVQGLMSLYLVQPDQDYLNLGLANATFIVKPGWQRYFAEFTPTNFAGTTAHARLLLLFHPNESTAEAAKRVDYWVDNISLTPIDYYAADSDPNRRFSWFDPDEEIVATNQLTVHVTAIGDNPAFGSAAGLTLILQDLESGGLLYQDFAVTAVDGHVRFTDVPIGEYLLRLQPEQDNVTAEPLWVAVEQEQVNEVELLVTQTLHSLYLPLIIQ